MASQRSISSITASSFSRARRRASDPSRRRKPVELAGVSTWITSREDLILSKLIWARDANSELQKRDVRTLLDDSVDWRYLRQWATKLGVSDMLEELSK
jgi:hypothetical protein